MWNQVHTQDTSVVTTAMTLDAPSRPELAAWQGAVLRRWPTDLPSDGHLGG